MGCTTLLMQWVSPYRWLHACVLLYLLSFACPPSIGLDDLPSKRLTCPSKNVDCDDFIGLVSHYQEQIKRLLPHSTRCSFHEGELAAFIAYAQAFPLQVLCLVDTYDALSSGTERSSSPYAFEIPTSLSGYRFLHRCKMCVVFAVCGEPPSCRGACV